jgi:hypothetical protein
MDAEGILVPARRGSRLSPHRGGTIKPAGTAILEQNPVEAERRRRTQARSDLGVIIPGNQQCGSSGFRPPRTPLGSRASKYIPGSNCGRRRDIQSRNRARMRRYDEDLVGSRERPLGKAATLVADGERRIAA